MFILRPPATVFDTPEGETPERSAEREAGIRARQEEWNRRQEEANALNKFLLDTGLEQVRNNLRSMIIPQLKSFKKFPRKNNKVSVLPPQEGDRDGEYLPVEYFVALWECTEDIRKAFNKLGDTMLHPLLKAFDEAEDRNAIPAEFTEEKR